MEFQREQDLRDQVGMITRASMAAGIDEWRPDPEPRVYEPLLPQGSRDEGEEVNEVNPETRVLDDPNGEEPEESEPEAEQPQDWSNARSWYIEWTGSWLTDWNPELGRLQEYRIREHSDDAESGEEYFMSNPLGGYQRRYRPSQSERDEWRLMRQRLMSSSDEVQNELKNEPVVCGLIRLERYRLWMKIGGTMTP